MPMTPISPPEPQSSPAPKKKDHFCCYWDWCRLVFLTSYELTHHVIHDHVRKAKPMKKRDIMWMKKSEKSMSGSMGTSTVSHTQQSSEGTEPLVKYQTDRQLMELPSSFQSGPPSPPTTRRGTSPPRHATISHPSSPFAIGQHSHAAPRLTPSPETPQHSPGSRSFAQLSSPFGTPSIPSLPASPALDTLLDRAIEQNNAPREDIVQKLRNWRTNKPDNKPARLNVLRPQGSPSNAHIFRQFRSSVSSHDAVKQNDAPPVDVVEMPRNWRAGGSSNKPAQPNGLGPLGSPSNAHIPTVSGSSPSSQDSHDVVEHQLTQDDDMDVDIMIPRASAVEAVSDEADLEWPSEDEEGEIRESGAPCRENYGSQASPLATQSSLHSPITVATTHRAVTPLSRTYRPYAPSVSSESFASPSKMEKVRSGFRSGEALISPIAPSTRPRPSGPCTQKGPEETMSQTSPLPKWGHSAKSQPMPPPSQNHQDASFSYPMELLTQAPYETQFSFTQTQSQ